MSRARGIGKLAAVASALGLGSSYVLIAGTAGIVLTGLVILPSTKSSRGIVTEKLVHDFRKSFGDSSTGEPGGKPGADSKFDAAGDVENKAPAEQATASRTKPLPVVTTADNRLKSRVSSNPGTNSTP
jgi:hypothetical protein